MDNNAGTTTLDGLSDVNAPTPTNGQALAWDSGTSQWTNQTISGGGLRTGSGKTFRPVGNYKRTTGQFSKAGYLMPLKVGTPMTIKSICVSQQHGTASDAGTWSLALYSSDSDAVPHSLLWSSAEFDATQSVGYDHSDNVAITPNIDLTVGWYWVGLGVSGWTTTRCGFGLPSDGAWRIGCPEPPYNILYEAGGYEVSDTGINGTFAGWQDPIGPNLFVRNSNTAGFWYRITVA